MHAKLHQKEIIDWDSRDKELENYVINTEEMMGITIVLSGVRKG